MKRFRSIYVQDKSELVKDLNEFNNKFNKIQSQVGPVFGELLEDLQNILNKHEDNSHRNIVNYDAALNVDLRMLESKVMDLLEFEKLSAFIPAVIKRTQE